MRRYRKVVRGAMAIAPDLDREEAAALPPIPHYRLKIAAAVVCAAVTVVVVLVALAAIGPNGKSASGTVDDSAPAVDIQQTGGQANTARGAGSSLSCATPIVGPAQADIAFFTNQLNPAIQQAAASPASAKSQGAVLAGGLTQLHGNDAAFQGVSCRGNTASIVAAARILHTDLERATSLASEGLVTGDANLLHEAGQSVSDVGSDATQMSTLLHEAGY